MNYIKNTNNFDISRDYDPVYDHTPYTLVKPAMVCEYVTLRDGIRREDIELFEFIYNMKFCTESQIERFCKAKEIEYSTDRLRYLFLGRYLNYCKFVHKDDRKNGRVELPEDALKAYFIDDATKVVLEKHTDLAFVDWGVDKALIGAYAIGKFLQASELYVKAVTETNMNILEYEGLPVFSIKKFDFSALAHYRYEKNGRINYLLVDAVRATDDKLGINKKLRFYESLLVTQFWKKYYPDTNTTPMLVIQIDDEVIGAYVAKTISDCTKITDFRLITLDRMKKSLGEKGAFLTYDREGDVLLEDRMDCFQ